MYEGRILKPGEVLAPLGVAATATSNIERIARDAHWNQSAATEKGTDPRLRRSGLRRPGGTGLHGSGEGTGNRFKVLNTFVDHTMAGIPGRDALAWLVLYRDTKPDGLARASVAHIARRMGCSRSTAKRSLSRLKALRLVEVVQQGGKDKGPNTYRVFASSDPLSPKAASVPRG